MTYQNYIDLGFKRIETKDAHVFRETGYYGYILTKDITDKITIELSFGELNKPKMYIKKRNSETCHIYDITCECVKDLILIV
jgi:hypothetical protein